MIHPARASAVLPVLLAALAVAVSIRPAVSDETREALAGSDRHLGQVRAPRGLRPGPAPGPVVVAVVDDAVRVSHRDIAPFLWTNRGEVPGNGVDDDGNGLVDDARGWDLADGDGDVAPPERRRDEFFHGTHLAGLVARVARAAYGESAPSHLVILPVKVLSDTAANTALKLGFEGVDYAVNAGADIVLCGWNVSQIGPRERAILDRARREGVLIVGSAGNFPENRPQFPGAHDGALAVAALDHENRKTADSNFGAFVDLSAPGTGVVSAGSRDDTAEEARDGTSQSAGLVAGAAAVVFRQHPGFSADEVMACLKHAAVPIEHPNPRYAAQLGAGALDVTAAVECSLLTEAGADDGDRRNPQGFLRLGSPGEPRGWTIRPERPVAGVRFRRRGDGDPGDGTLSFFAEQSPRARRILRAPADELPESVYVPGMQAHVIHEPGDGGGARPWLLEYRAEPIDLPTLHCRGRVERDEEGILEDGSGPSDYSWNTDCKWLITAPEGKVIHIRFTEFDTEAKADFVYLFDGTGTHEKILARFSGSDLPPEVTSWRNQVLVWFVTDGDRQGRGWKAEYTFRDP